MEISPTAPLTDRFGRRHSVLRIGLTERCNLRCVYCMPAAGVPLMPKGSHLATDEIARVARVLAGAGVDRIRLTGGEPLVRKDAVEVARRLGALAGVRSLAMTTNALLLERHLPALVEAGLTHLTISLDTLRPERFEALTRRDGLAGVLGAVDAALAAGYGTEARPLKVNTVVLRGQNDDEAADLVAWAAGLSSPERRIELRFIEAMPFDGNGWGREVLVPWDETKARVEAAHGELVPLVDAAESTSRTFAVPGTHAVVGFVASMTAPFCAGCNRLRVTADGALKVCLFGGRETSLRDAMRAGATDADLLALVRAALAGKHAAHAGMDALALTPNRPMVAIGG
ncbi:MAG TPA: GTP 3',8-cyclase MoaA [Rhodothermales bacterium]|nr:GTP 3',8-cyclase MoaA [Rhodothermales bacterium]